jgi:2-C-methyl-D-erythritol 4-phosphate cytidylyltransferase
VDTLKLVEPTRGTVLRTVDRRGLWIVQTPQVFPRAVLERVHARVAGSAEAATDDLSLVERAGGRVRLVDGDPRNLKVTFPADARIAEALVLAADRAAEPRERRG